MYLLHQNSAFPTVHLANEDGLLAIGGDLSPKRLLLAYRNGIFPWFNAGQPLLWYSPNPRMVLFPDQLKVSKSMRQLLRKNRFNVTTNTAFDAVIRACSSIPRVGQEGSWITAGMIDAYTKLHQLGHAVSVEVWEEDTLVGGLYGIDLPEYKIFCGESMFSLVSNASKTAFIWWTQQLHEQGYRLIDCQMHTTHLASLGAKEISRVDFLKYLKD